MIEKTLTNDQTSGYQIRLNRKFTVSIHGKTD
jgi:hypothetical protein